MYDGETPRIRDARTEFVAHPCFIKSHCNNTVSSHDTNSSARWRGAMSCNINIRTQRRNPHYTAIDARCFT
jgi:hypothetical protein